MVWLTWSEKLVGGSGEDGVTTAWILITASSLSSGRSQPPLTVLSLVGVTYFFLSPITLCASPPSPSSFPSPVTPFSYPPSVHRSLRILYTQ